MTHRRLMRFGERHTENAFGVDVGNDSVGGPLGLYLTTATARRDTVRADDAEAYANWGLGYHSNSALGILLKVDPFTGDPATAAPAFSRAMGTEIGVRTVAVQGLQTTVTGWLGGRQ